MKGQHHIGAVMFAEKAVLDMDCRHRHERACVLLARTAVRRRVENTNKVRIWAEYRRRAACQPHELAEEMLSPVHRDRLAGGRDRSKRIGAANGFAPNPAWADSA